jgi:hypothetical protein
MKKPLTRDELDAVPEDPRTVTSTDPATGLTTIQRLPSRWLNRRDDGVLVYHDGHGNHWYVNENEDGSLCKERAL